jgi:Ca2+-binding RTX toxin-like protein
VKIPGRRRVALLILVALGLLCAPSALTGANTVPASRAGTDTRAIGLNDAKPADCAGITVTTLVSGSGPIAGTSGNDLVLGSAAVDTVTAGLGNDCVLGGGGNDTIDGGALGQDVCIGGPGTDTFVSCEVQVQ